MANIGPTVGRMVDQSKLPAHGGLSPDCPFSTVSVAPSLELGACGDLGNG